MHWWSILFFTIFRLDEWIRLDILKAVRFKQVPDLDWTGGKWFDLACLLIWPYTHSKIDLTQETHRLLELWRNQGPSLASERDTRSCLLSFAVTLALMWAVMGTQGSPVKSYDYLLKFLLVGDSDVGKGEILDSLQDGSAESPYAYSSGELVNTSHTSSCRMLVTHPSARIISDQGCHSQWAIQIILVLTGLPNNMVNIVFLCMVSLSVGAILWCHWLTRGGNASDW